MTKAQLRDAVAKLEPSGPPVQWHTIDRYEKGELGLSGPRRIAVAKALGVRPEWIERGEGPMRPLTVVAYDEPTPPSVERAIEFLGSRISEETAQRALGVKWGEGAPDDAGAVAYLMNLEAKRAGRQLESERRAGDEETARAETERKRAGLRKPPPKKRGKPERP